MVAVLDFFQYCIQVLFAEESSRTLRVHASAASPCAWVIDLRLVTTRTKISVKLHERYLSCGCASKDLF